MTRHRDHPGKAHVPGNEPLHFLNFLLVSFEQLHKGGLGTGGPLGAQELQVGQLIRQIFHILGQLIDPQGGPLAHGGELGRLQMGIAQAGLVPVGFGKGGQIFHHLGALLKRQAAGLPEDHHIGVVSYIAAGRPQVDDPRRLGALLPIGIDVAHHIVTHQTLPLLGHGVIDVVLMRFQLCDLLLCDLQPQLPLRLGQRDPQPPPGAEFKILRENMLHLSTGIPGGQRRNIGVMISFHTITSLS